MKRFLATCRLPVVVVVFAAWWVVLGTVLKLAGPLFARPSDWNVKFSPEGTLTIWRYENATLGWTTWDRDMNFLSEQDSYASLYDQPRIIMAPMQSGRERADGAGIWQLSHAASYARWPNILPERYDGATRRTWYWLPDEKVFELYDAGSRRSLGRMGADGFAPHGRARPFGDVLTPWIAPEWHVPASTWVIVPTLNEVYLVHLSERTVRNLVRKSEAVIKKAAITPFVTWSTDMGRGVQEDATVYVNTTEALECYDSEGSLMASVPLTDAEKRAQVLEVGRTGTGTIVLVAWPRGWRLMPAEPAVVRWVDHSGTTLDTAELRLPEGIREDPSPLLKLSRAALVPLPYMHRRPRLAPLPADRERDWPQLATALLAGLVCAAVTGVHARRCFVTRRATILWCVFTLTCGVAALLTYFTASGRPRLERCNACGRRKPLAACTCPQCGAQVPAPPAKGIELFA